LLNKNKKLQESVTESERAAAEKQYFYLSFTTEHLAIALFVQKIAKNSFRQVFNLFLPWFTWKYICLQHNHKVSSYLPTTNKTPQGVKDHLRPQPASYFVFTTSVVIAFN